MNSTTDKPEENIQEPKPIDISQLDIYQLLELFIVLLSEQAWRDIGIKVVPGTSEIRKDLTKAHVSIDCIISIVDKIEPQLEDSEKERLRKLITDLQINYAQHMK